MELLNPKSIHVQLDAETESAFDWDELNLIEKFESRQKINPLFLENLGHDFVEKVIDLISDQSKSLLCRALIEADKFAIAEKEVRPDKEERTNLRCRVRLSPYNSLEIAWYRLKSFRISEDAAIASGKTFSRTVNGEKAKFLLKGCHIKKGSSKQYSSKEFKDEPEWVRRIVEENEKRNELLRTQSEILSNIRRLLFKYDSLTSKYYDDIVHPSFQDERKQPRNSKGDDSE